MAELYAYIRGFDGSLNALPRLLAAQVCHGCGEPCDSAELSIMYVRGMEEKLASALELELRRAGKTVFRGLVDEYEISLSASGGVVSISARGMAARLMDNESEACEYALADISSIIERHVLPCGVTDIALRSMPTVRGYRVSSGASQWDALRDFTLCAAGEQPHFDRTGRLHLGSREGKLLSVSDKTPVTHVTWRDRRYGIISEVLVIDNSTHTKTIVENADFKARGGRCRRVMNVTTRRDYRPARMSGEHQLAASQRGSRLLRLELPWAFAADVYDRVQFSHSSLGISGVFTVTDTLCRYDDNGWSTELDMEVS